MPKIELTHIQILEYIILGIKNGQYQAAINLAQDCIDELSAQPNGSEKRCSNCGSTNLEYDGTCIDC